MMISRNSAMMTTVIDTDILVVYPAKEIGIRLEDRQRVADEASKKL